MARLVNPIRALPKEIFDIVLENVAPSPVPTLFPPPTADQDNTDLDQPEHNCWEDWFEAREDLVCLSLASIRHRNRCEPLLWRGLAFRSERALRALLLTVHIRPYLGQLIKAMYVGVTGLNDATPFSSM